MDGVHDSIDTRVNGELLGALVARDSAIGYKIITEEAADVRQDIESCGLEIGPFLSRALVEGQCQQRKSSNTGMTSHDRSNIALGMCRDASQ